MVVVVSRLLGTVCRSGGGHLVRARRRRHVRVLRILGDVQIVGSLTPNSAAAERVFSMLKQMFGDTQMRALMDMIQAALMLKYNGRTVG